MPSIEFGESPKVLAIKSERNASFGVYHMDHIFEVDGHRVVVAADRIHERNYFVYVDRELVFRSYGLPKLIAKYPWLKQYTNIIKRRF